jgi:hypothetical protein
MAVRICRRSRLKDSRGTRSAPTLEGFFRRKSKGTACIHVCHVEQVDALGFAKRHREGDNLLTSR